MGWVDVLILAIVVLEIGVGIGLVLGAILASNKIADLEAELLRYKEGKVGARVRVKKTGFDSVEFCCPHCDARQISQIGGEWIAGKRNKFCADCGQALDWSDIAW